MTEHSRKWSSSGLGLDAAEAEARRLEKKGTFSATMDDEAGTVTLSKDDFKAVMSKLGGHKEVAKRSRANLVLLAFGYLAVSVGFIAVIVGLMNWRIEATKESRVTDSELVGKNGKVVASEQSAAFVTLMDIPKMGTEYLSKLSTLSYVFKGEFGTCTGCLLSREGATGVIALDVNIDRGAFDLSTSLSLSLSLSRSHSVPFSSFLILGPTHQKGTVVVVKVESISTKNSSSALIQLVGGDSIVVKCGTARVYKGQGDDFPIREYDLKEENNAGVVRRMLVEHHGEGKRAFTLSELTYTAEKLFEIEAASGRALKEKAAPLTNLVSLL